MTNNFLAALPQLWAIRPEALTAFVEDLRLMAADARSRDGNAAPARKPYSMDGPVAVIPVEGVLTKKGLSFFGIQLAPGMRDLAAALRRAAADRSVKAILLDVDSPGGTVDGIEELAEAVAETGRAKPLYAFADGLMASAGYWLSCGAREIAAPATAEVGSIGVVMMHREYSKALDEAGVTYNIIAAGHYKAAGNTVEPLTDEMRAYLQSGVDDTYEQFLQAVERGRNVSREKALAMGKEETRRFFAEAAAYLTDFVGRENVVSAMVHMDEKTPHMHFLHVPVTPDGRLCAKDIYTKAALRKLQDELPRHLQNRGFQIERGVEQQKGSAKKHLDTREFKQQQEMMAARRKLCCMSATGRMRPCGWRSPIFRL